MYERMLIVVGLEPATQAAVSEGIGLAQAQGSEILFFAVQPQQGVTAADISLMGLPTSMDLPDDSTTALRRRLADAATAATEAGVPCRTAMGAAVDDADGIVDAVAQWRCDAIVVATTGGNAVTRLLAGSVIPGLITRAPVPVIVVRPRAEADAGRDPGVAVAGPQAPP